MRILSFTLGTNDIPIFQSKDSSRIRQKHTYSRASLLRNTSKCLSLRVTQYGVSAKAQKVSALVVPQDSAAFLSTIVHAYLDAARVGGSGQSGAIPEAGSW